MVVVTVLLAAAGVGAYFAGRWWHHRAPYGPEALSASATLDLVTFEAAQAALGEGVNAPFPQPGGQLVLGRVTWSKPPQPLAGGWFQILVIDQRTFLKPAVFSVSPARLDSVSVGSDGVLGEVERKYPWLRGAGFYRDANDSWWDTGDSVSVFNEAASPVTFVALFPAAQDPMPRRELARATAPVAISDLLVAMVYIGPDRQVYWAQRLL